MLSGGSAFAQHGAAQQATAAEDLASRFGAREGVLSISISPDGTRLAVVAPAAVGEGEEVQVYGLDGTGLEHTFKGSRGDGDRLQACRWANDRRLLCTVRVSVPDNGQIAIYQRALAVDPDGRNSIMLGHQENADAQGLIRLGGQVIDVTSPDGDGAVLMFHQTVPSAHLASGPQHFTYDSGFEVISTDTMTGKSHMVEPAKMEAIDYLSDQQGHVRVMGLKTYDNNGYHSTRTSWRFRIKGDRTWLPLGTSTFHASGSDGFQPVAVDAQADAVYGLAGDKGVTVLKRRRLVVGAPEEMVIGHDGVDIDGLVQLGRHRRVIGATYVDERRRVDYFDEALKRLVASLAKAFPTGSEIGVIDASDDENRLLIMVTSDINPGAYYLYDKPTHRLSALLTARPALAAQALAPMTAVRFPARDGTIIPAYLTLPPGRDGKGLPAIVMPHGGPESRDEWGFDWLVQYFANRGFAIIQPEFRGSTGYGTNWFGKNGFQSWATAIDDVDDAGRWLIAQGIARPDRLAAVGWSYGGYAALQGAVVDPQLFKAVVAIAPVTDLASLRADEHEYDDFLIEAERIGEGPHIKAGSPAQNAERIAAPVLLFHGGRDVNVSIHQSRLMRDRLKGAGKVVDLVEFPQLDHQLDSAAARAALLTRADHFLSDALRLDGDRVLPAVSSRN